MKIAYLTSRYPAVSHTFVLREVQALRARGFEIETFSVRRSEAGDILGEAAEQEASRTRWLVPPSGGQLLAAFVWALTRRPMTLLRTLAKALSGPGLSLSERARWLAYFGEAVMLAHWLTHERFDRLHCHFGNNGASTGMLAAWLAGVPFSFTCHGSELLEPVKHRLVEKVACSTFVVCVSKFGRARLMLLCPPEHWTRLAIVRCGQPFDEDVLEAAENETPEILCVGRLSREKGHLVLLEALARLRDAGVRFHCTLVGDGPMRSMIERQTSLLGLNDRLTLTGSLPPERVAEHYERADLVVLPSFSEGVPIVLMEAMSCGRPVVATRVGGVPEIVEHEGGGLLVSPGDPDELAVALRRLVDEPLEARQMAERGARYVRDEFSVERSIPKLAALFEHGTASAEVTDSNTLQEPRSCPTKLLTPSS